MRASGGKRAGRSHRQKGLPCQDAFALLAEPGAGRAAAAVGDGLGSRALSHLGSEAACQAAVASLRADTGWDKEALVRAFEAARLALEGLAAEQGAAPDDFATTLQVAGLAQGRAVGAIVGDGAVVGCTDRAEILLPPEQAAEYANEVVPVTHPGWRSHFRYAELDGAECLLMFTDGLTRLLLSRSRGEWTPFMPFFDAFLPKVRGPGFDEELVPRFLDGDQVDSSWDDDKCLVVIGRDDKGL